MSTGTFTSAARRPRHARRVALRIELVVLALVAAALVLGRAGFVGSPISYVVVAGHSMEPTLHTGDVVVLRRSSRYRRGDIVGYEVPRGGPGAGLIVIHRIVGGGGPREGFIMRGDNKPSPDPWRPAPEDVVGRELVMIPKIGLWIEYIRTPLGIAVLAGLITLAIALGDSGEKRPRRARGTRSRRSARGR